MSSADKSTDREIFGSKLGEILDLSLKIITEVDRMESVLALEETVTREAAKQKPSGRLYVTTGKGNHGAEYDPFEHTYALVTEGRVLGFY